MLYLDADRIRGLVSTARVIDCLEAAFREGCVAPSRLVSEMPDAQRLFLAMPAFGRDGRAVAKLVTVFPDNPGKGLPAIQAAIVVFSREGTPVALLDGTQVTQMRTGAASALASRYLSRVDSSHLLVIGTGALAPAMAEAHCLVRPITRISVWGRNPSRTEFTAAAIRTRVAEPIEVVVAPSIESAVPTADIVCCATSAREPLLCGEWLKEGAFVDLVGSFSPSKREADDEVVRQSRIFVDTIEGALSEAGDLLQPLAHGVIRREQIEADLADLVCGRNPGRTNSRERITFKSVGAALEDFATANLLVAMAHESRRS